MPESSVIVCTRYRPDQLARCLASLGNLDGPDREVVVVDNSPGDEATERVTSRAGARYIVEPRAGLSRARNTGIYATTAELIAFIDDDAVAESAWLRRHSDALAEDSLFASTGRIVPMAPKEGHGYEAAGELDLGEEAFTIDRSDPRWFERANFGGLGFGGNMAFKRRAFNHLRFRETLGLGTDLDGCEDFYLFFKMINSGARVAYVPGAVVRHGGPELSAAPTEERTAEAHRLSTAYLTMLLVEERGFRFRTMRYIVQVLGRGQNPWRPPNPDAQRAGRLKMLVAGSRGPLLYLRSRLKNMNAKRPPRKSAARHLLRTSALTVLGVIGRPCASLFNRTLQLTDRRAGVALVYHAIGPGPGNGNNELLPPISPPQFRRQLEYLVRNFNVVPVEEFRSAVASRRRGEKFPVCLSFDDDLPEHTRYAMPELRRRGVPATFFLCGASLQAPRSFWWERLQRAFDNAVPLSRVVDLLPTSAAKRLDGEALGIHGVAAVIQSLRAVERDQLDARLLEIAGPDPPDSGIRAEAISALIDGGCAVGFHTRRHYELVELSDEELEEALVEGRDELEGVVNRPVNVIAYPHGAADERVAEAAGRAGFSLGFTTRQRATTRSTDPMLMGRLDPINRHSLGELSLALIATLLLGPTGDGRPDG